MTESHQQQTMTLSVSLLRFDTNEHRFSSDIHISAFCGNEWISFRDSERILWRPSDTWMNAYREWNNFGEQNGIPHFDSAQALHHFNEVGKRLEAALKQEVTSFDRHKNNRRLTVCVEPFRPLYAAIEVGSVTAWWHIRDANYKGLIIPIQHLPVSDDLKMRLQAWRMRIGQSSFRKDARMALNAEGHELERDILAELDNSKMGHHNHNSRTNKHFYSSNMASNTSGSGSTTSSSLDAGAIEIENSCC